MSTANHTSASTDSSPLPFSSTSDWFSSCWTCVIGVLYLVSSVSFSCPLPRIPSGSPLPASVPRSGVLRFPWCHFCLSPPAQVCVATLELPGGVISLRRLEFHSPSPAPFLRAVCGLSSAPLLPTFPYSSVCLRLRVPQYPPMKWRWQCALFLLLSASLGMLGGNGPFRGICSTTSVDPRRTLAPCVRL